MEPHGKSWKRVLFVDPGSGCSDISANADNSNVIYAGMYSFHRWAWYFTSGGGSTALYKSVNGGETWEKLSGPQQFSGLPRKDMDRIGVAVMSNAAGGGDIVAELFKPLPSMVVAHYLGVPEVDWGRFDVWTDAIVTANAAQDESVGAGAAADPERARQPARVLPFAGEDRDAVRLSLPDSMEIITRMSRNQSLTLLLIPIVGLSLAAWIYALANPPEPEPPPVDWIGLLASGVAVPFSIVPARSG